MDKFALPSVGLTSPQTRREDSSSVGHCSAPGAGCSPAGSSYQHHRQFFSRPSPKAGRELHIDRMMEGGMMQGEGGPLSKNQHSPGRESTQRLCTCSSIVYCLDSSSN